jgi:flagellar assembly protein FliH
MASVLKSASTANSAEPASHAGLAGFNFEDLSQQARRQLQQCQDEIAKLRSEAEAEIETMRARAHAEGFAAGREEATRDAEQKFQSAVEARITEHGAAMQAMVQQIAQQHQQWMQQYRETLVSLVMAVSEKVVRGRLEREPDIILRWASEALVAARTAERLWIAVHPETLAQLGPALDELLNQPGLPEDTSIIPDESVAAGSVVVRQLGGEVAVTLNGQLQRLQELLEHA